MVGCWVSHCHRLQNAIHVQNHDVAVTESNLFVIYLETRKEKAR